MTCRDCDGAGFVSDGTGAVRRCACDGGATDPLGGIVPERERRATREECQHVAELDAALVFMRDGHDVRLVGETGRGKSCIAALMLRDAVGVGAEVGWLNVPTWLETIRGAMGTSSAQSTMEHVRPDVLVVDDIGAERGTEWELDVVARLLRLRESSNKLTIATTNLPLDGERSIRSVYGDRLWSTLGRYRQVVIKGADRRLERDNETKLTLQERVAARRAKGEANG